MWSYIFVALISFVGGAYLEGRFGGALKSIEAKVEAAFKKP